MTITSTQLKEKAFELGWDDIGLTTPNIPEEDIKAYFSWINNNHHADLEYMKNSLRTQPEKLLPGAKTAVMLITSYKQEQKPFRKDAGLIASYARGRNYHNVLYKKLKKLIQWLSNHSKKESLFKPFCDSTPILEKALAVKAGLGWFGKNTLLIHRKLGTFTFLSGFLTNLEFPIEEKNERSFRCGSCTRCLDACPTNALISPYQLNATRCLSYHTIESKNKIPEEIARNNPGYVFGCDICQDVCPHNKRPPETRHKEFQENQGIGAYLTLDKLTSLEVEPSNLFGSPLQRQGVSRLKETSKKLLS
jgi:epoxyqueuosine reductase